MKKEYKYLDTKTFEIKQITDIEPIDSKLINIISILNKKGYYVENYNMAKLFTPFLLSSLINGFIEENIITITEDTKDKIKKTISYSDIEANYIIFKEIHKFVNLPLGFEQEDNVIINTLSILKKNDGFELKTLIELDKEQRESIAALEQWATNLPNIKEA